ncbi:hypothetical protein ABW20_dc0109313 [Dactylellina cionopaga]|nr:hypothetical protein ABW20_dc0109313 [Dactylellina cionopaga]
MAVEVSHPIQPTSLSEEQTEQYLEFLQFTEDEAKVILEPTLENLKILMLRHLAIAPFCNIDIHYSKAHKIIIDLDFIFNKVVRLKRGGYCMEMNTLFSHLLAKLGFDIWLAPSRVSRERTGNIDNRNFYGISHCVNLVEFENGKIYLVDVAFGSGCIVQPMELVEGSVVEGVCGEKHRLIRAAVPETRRKKLHWLVQHQEEVDGPWIDRYMFLEDEVTIRDCEIWSNWSSTMEGIFMQNILVSRLIREGNKAVGKYTMLNGKMKKIYYTDVEELPELKSEEDRVCALKEYWDIELSEDDKNAIKGRAPEILTS